MKRMKLKTSTARLTSAGLLLILAVSSFLLSGAVSSLNSPVAIGPGRRFIDLGGNYTEVGSGGRIVVKTQGSFGGFAGGFSGVLPLSGVNISIRGATSPALAALTFHTNSSGTFELPLDPGQYSVAINDQRFHLSTAVNILPGEVTEVDVLATRQLHPITFYAVVDRDSSGWLTTWEMITAVTDSGIQPVNKSTALFLEVLRPPYSFPNSVTVTLPNSSVIVKVQPVVFTYLFLPQETRLSLLGLDQRGSVVWLTLRPMESIKISDGMGLGVALYKPSYGAFTYAA
ncbi:MAG: hypothetical protein E6K90_04610 [Thaumarchaeota archaeon]|nr:MAG: hypothetical protein E6K90_04610 [Nitrososphaerota archaeon]